jgi:hypothetical protein
MLCTVGQDAILRGGWLVVGQAILPATAFQAALAKHARVFASAQRRLKAGGSQDWPPHLDTQSHLSFSVVKAQSASTSPAIQNLAMIFDSAQPSASKW